MHRSKILLSALLCLLPVRQSLQAAELRGGEVALRQRQEAPSTVEPFNVHANVFSSRPQKVRATLKQGEAINGLDPGPAGVLRTLSARADEGVLCSDRWVDTVAAGRRASGSSSAPRYTSVWPR